MYSVEWIGINTFTFIDDLLANVAVTIGQSLEEVSSDSGSFLCAYLPGLPPTDEFTLTCTEIMYGRFIRVTAKEMNDVMRLREIKVYGW